MFGVINRVEFDARAITGVTIPSPPRVGETQDRPSGHEAPASPFRLGQARSGSHWHAPRLLW